MFADINFLPFLCCGNEEHIEKDETTIECATNPIKEAYLSTRQNNFKCCAATSLKFPF